MKLNNASGLLPENYNEPSVCESCGETFGCGAGLEGCWCAGMTLPEQAKEGLKTKFLDCLCPACLAKYAIVRAERH